MFLILLYHYHIRIHNNGRMHIQQKHYDLLKYNLYSNFLLLLPLNRSRRFARDVVDDAVDVGYFVDDAGADGLQHFPWKASEVTRHAVDTRYGTDSDRVVVCSTVTHYPQRCGCADAWKNREVLPYVTFKAVFGDFFA